MTFRAAWRSLSRAPGFVVLVAITLGIGIGTTTAVFSVVDAVLLRPLRFAGADRALGVWTRPAEGASVQPGASDIAFRELRDHLANLAAIEGYSFGAATITGGAEPFIVSVPSVTRGLLPLIGASPILGRLFNEEDEATGATSVLISERLWTSHFGRDQNVVGRRIALDGQPHTIVGVLPDRVRYPEASAAVWTPLTITVAPGSRRRVQTLVVRHPDVPIERLRSQLTAISLSLREQGAFGAGQSLLLDDVTQVRVSRSNGRPLWVIFGAVGLVLLVACINVATLLLMRGSNRRGELAVLTALGADRSALIRQVATEVVLLSVAGVVVGVALAAGLIRALVLLIPPQITYLTSTTPDLNWQVIGFAAATAVLASLIAGLVPAWRSSRVDVVDVMKSQSRGIGGPSHDRWQAAMLAVQLATVVVLLGGTGLLLRSFMKITSEDPGYDAASVVAVSIELPAARYAREGAALGAMEDLARQIGDAGVGSASFSTGAAISFEIQPEAEGGQAVDASGMVLPWTRVAANFFETMGIPVLQGRSLQRDDGPDVMVVNDKLAYRFWGNESPVGRRFRLDSDEPWRQVVGVVGDVRTMGLDDPTGHGMEFYVPFSRNETRSGYTLVVRSSHPTEAVVARVKDLLRTIDRDAPVLDAGSMRDAMLESLYRQRFVLRLSTAFAATALILAGIGLYGVTAYWVTRRRRDLAIRVAVGATGTQVLKVVLTRAAIVTFAGTALGVAGSFAAGRVLRTMLYETTAADPMVLAGTTGIMAVLVVIACLMPVRTALSIDPAIVLRES